MKRPQDLVEAWRRGEAELAPVTALLGIRLIEAGEGRARIGMAAGARHHNAMGTVHGGIFCDLADVAIGVALATALDEGETFVTLDLVTHYLRPVRESRLIASARVVRRGRSSAYLECDVLDGDENLVARVASTCMIHKLAGSVVT